jgi:hypothetical protein
MGVIRACDTRVYESMLVDQIDHARENSKTKDMNELLRSGNTFEVE